MRLHRQRGCCTRLVVLTAAGYNLQCITSIWSAHRRLTSEHGTNYALTPHFFARGSLQQKSHVSFRMCCIMSKRKCFVVVYPNLSTKYLGKGCPISTGTFYKPVLTSLTPACSGHLSLMPTLLEKPAALLP